MRAESVSRIVFQTPAKINFLLAILGKRPDGYHEILTVMQMVSLWDEVLLESEKDITIRCPGSGLSEGPDNLAWQAAYRLKEFSGYPGGVFITLRKGIPVTAGLGGGSSDAAAVLYGLNRLWGLGYTPEELTAVGRQIGSDVPFFFSGPAAYAWGRGDHVIPLDGNEKRWLVLVNPGFPVSTAWAYQQVQAGSFSPPSQEIPDGIKGSVEFGLTKACRHIKIPPHPALQVRGGRLRVFPRNDLTAGVVQGYPEVGRVLKQLESCGSSIVMMSGSGPTCFGVFDEREAAHAAGLVMEQMGWRSWVVRCLGRSPYSM